MKLKTFCKFTESTIHKRVGIVMSKYFQRWKSHIVLENAHEEYETTKKQTIHQNE